MGEQIDPYWIMAAYGSTAGKYLLENLPLAETPEERVTIIGTASQMDRRIFELDPLISRIQTPFAIPLDLSDKIEDI